MKINEAGLKLVKQFEGLRLQAYRCPAGVWTIGYGHTLKAFPGEVITEQQAEALLLEDLEDAENTVTAAVTAPLTGNQFSALVSFTFNVGERALQRSTLLKVLNGGNYKRAADEFLRWNKASGRELSGLTRRRKAERGLFLTPDAVNGGSIWPK